MGGRQEDGLCEGQQGHVFRIQGFVEAVPLTFRNDPWMGRDDPGFHKQRNVRAQGMESR